MDLCQGDIPICGSPWHNFYAYAWKESSDCQHE